MKKGAIIALIGGISCIGYGLFHYFTVQKNLLTKFTYNILNVQFSNISLQNITANLLVRFTNSANFEVKVNKFYVDIYVNGVNVGYFVDSGVFTIVANGTSDIPITVSFNPTIVLTNITSIASISLNLNDITIGVHGFAQVSSSFVNITIPVDYDSTIKNMMS